MKDLLRIAQRFTKKAAALDVAVESTLTTKIDPLHAMAVQRISTINLYAGWEEFTHRLLLSSSYAKPYTASGIRLIQATGITCRQDFEDEVKRAFNRNPNVPWSPSWGRIQHVRRILSHVQPQNSGTVLAALSSATSPTDDLRLARNFFGHVNPDTARQVQRLLVFQGSGSLEAWICQRNPQGNTKFSEWVVALQDMAYAAVQ